MIVTLEGVMGAGKTLTAVALAYSEHIKNGRDVLANCHLTFPYTFLDLNFFMDHIQDGEISDSVIILDEAYIYLDSRTSSGKLNKLFTYFLVQTRKRDVDLYIPTHHIDIIDKRLRRAVDVRGTCTFKKEDPCKRCGGSGQYKELECGRCLGNGVTGWATTRFLDLRSNKRFRIKVHGPAFWGLYDTKERVPFTQKQMKVAVEDL